MKTGNKMERLERENAVLHKMVKDIQKCIMDYESYDGTDNHIGDYMIGVIGSIAGSFESNIRYAELMERKKAYDSKEQKSSDRICSKREAHSEEEYEIEN